MGVNATSTHLTSLSCINNINMFQTTYPMHCLLLPRPHGWTTLLLYACGGTLPWHSRCFIFCNALRLVSLLLRGLLASVYLFQLLYWLLRLFVTTLILTSHGASSARVCLLFGRSTKWSKRLLPKRYRPFTIKVRIWKVAYRLNLPTSIKVHNMFHINLLLPYKETEAYGPAYIKPPPDLIKGEEEYKVELICDARRKGRGRKLQYLMHWKGYPNSNDSWVNHNNLHTPELLKQFYTSSAVARWPNV